MARTKVLSRYEIMNDPIGSLSNWPALSADFDRRWADDPEKTFGERLKLATALALQILTDAGVVPSRKTT